ncbi:hypothetical protein ZIOFF_047947 [Zingiber officinale]|uniref:Uncharacterized protein n=1 Tax=Zingiber officinale TaxID=94328 RepID=A0A8J5FU59_ZINOF|nr:hypothetical protein ZIOFF_047947 [Zingiber officinale]
MPSAIRKRPKSRPPETSKPLQFIGREPSTAIFPSKADLLRLFAVVAIAASVAAACNYAVYLLNRQDKPFCDSIEGILYSTQVSVSLALTMDGAPVGVWSVFMVIRSRAGNALKMESSIRLLRKLYALEYIELCFAMQLDLLEEHVCKAYGQVLCKLPGKIWFQEAEIKDIIEEHVTRSSIGLKADTSKFIKDTMMEAVESVLEAKAINNRSKEYKCPDMLAEFHKPLHCRINQWIYKHAGILLAIFVLVCQIRIVSVSDGLLEDVDEGVVAWKYRARSESLQQVCEILQENAMRAMSGENKGERWVVASWLRDQLLLPRERKHTILWKKVEELIMEDSRIDQYPKLIKGESKVVLEWQVDGPLTSMLKEKESASKAKTFSGNKGSYQNEEEKKYKVAAHLFS